MFPWAPILSARDSKAPSCTVQGPLWSNSVFMPGLSAESSLHNCVWEPHPSKGVDNQVLFKLSEDRFERTDAVTKSCSRKASLSQLTG